MEGSVTSEGQFALHWWGQAENASDGSLAEGLANAESVVGRPAGDLSNARARC